MLWVNLRILPPDFLDLRGLLLAGEIMSTSFQKNGIVLTILSEPWKKEKNTAGIDKVLSLRYRLCKRLFSVFVQKKVGVDDAGFLVDCHGQNDVSAAAGIEDGIAGKFQGARGLTKG